MKLMGCVYNTFTVHCENFKIVFLTSSRINVICVSPIRFRFPVKLVCCIAFGSTPFAQIYCNYPVVYCKAWISKQRDVKSSPWPVAIFEMFSFVLMSLFTD